MKALLRNIYDFLATYDFPTLLKAFDTLEWSQVARSVYTWLIALPILIFLLWTKKYKAIVAIASLFLFVLLIQRTFSPGGETLSLNDLFKFLGGAVALVGLNIYLIFVRQ